MFVQIVADPKHLGAKIGITAVLVPGGGLSFDGKSWVACRPGFFLPVRALSRLFGRTVSEEADRGPRRGPPGASPVERGVVLALDVR